MTLLGASLGRSRDQAETLKHLGFRSSSARKFVDSLPDLSGLSKPLFTAPLDYVHRSSTSKRWVRGADKGAPEESRGSPINYSDAD
jgi:hypothetical protein